MGKLDKISFWSLEKVPYDGVRLKINGELVSAESLDKLLRRYDYLENYYDESHSKLEEYQKFFCLLKKLLNLNELTELSGEVDDLREDLKRTNSQLANHEVSNNVHRRWL